MKVKRKAVPGLSPRAQKVWDELDEKTKKDIQKMNPFKINRDRAIRELIKGKGLRGEILEELTGLNESSIYRIARKGDDLPDYVKQDVKGLIKAFQAFLNSLSVILANKYRKRDEKNNTKSGKSQD